VGGLSESVQVWKIWIELLVGNISPTFKEKGSGKQGNSSGVSEHEWGKGGSGKRGIGKTGL